MSESTEAQPSRGTLKKKIQRWTATMTVLVLAFGFIPGVAYASHFTGSGGLIGGFEVDGDFIATGVNKDWNNIGGVVMVSDTASPAADDIFNEGSKEQSPDGWSFNPAGSAPGKTDFTRLYYAATLVPTSTANIWLGFERLDVEGKGDAHVNFELNQDAGTILNSGGVAIPKRTAGDLLVVYDYDGGDKLGDAVNIEIREWTGGALAGAWSSPIVGLGAIGDVNGVTGTARPAAAPFGGGTVDQKRFGEVGIDLLRFFPTFFSSCRNFSTFWAKSRASGESFNSVLKDKTPRRTIELNTCDANVQITPATAINEVGTTHTFTGHVNVKPGLAFVNAPIGTVIGFTKVSGPGTLSAPTCTTTDLTGSCSVTMVSASPGTTVVKATTDVLVGGTTLHRETNNQGGNSAAATKNWVDYRVLLTPANATNAVGATHTFTATLERDTGSGWASYPGQTLSLSLAPGVSDAHLVEINSTPASGTAGSCTTSASGTCDIKINSSTAGGSTLTATFNTTLDSGPVTRSTSANKQYVSFRLDVTPARATNEVGTTHTFTVSLDRDSGSGYTDYAGQTVTLTLVAGLTNAHLVEINGASASGTTGTCTTNGTGQCIVKIFSSVPGSVQLQAGYGTLLDSGVVSLQKSADKDYVDFRLGITPARSTNEVGTTHTFTVSLDRDTGSGFADYAGQTIALTLAPGASDARFVQVNGAAASGTSATCTTTSSGTCTVRIFASTPGAVRLSTAWGTTLDSGQVVRAATADKQYNDYRLSMTPVTSTNEVGSNHVFSLLLERNTGAGWAPYSGQTVGLTLVPGVSNARLTSIDGAAASGTSGTCVTAVDGTCDITISASTPGAVRLDASWGTTLDSGALTRVASANKQYMDYSLAVTPANATNEVGQPHTFTVSLKSNSGSGMAAYPGQLVTLTLSPGASDARFTTVNGAAASGTTAGCTTSAAGTCTVVINASTPGTIAMNASWGTTLDSGAVTRQAAATKQYNDYRIALTPPVSTNEVGTTHVFTVLLERNTGTGWSPYSGQGVTLTLTQGATNSRFTSINGSSASGTASTCTTTTLGTCEVRISSTEAGLALLSAAWGTTLDSGAVTRSASATKQYNDYTLAVTPDVAVNEVNDPHTFTVTLQRDTGSGMTGYAGQSISLNLNAGTSDAQLTSINGSTASGTSTSCTTNASGQCTVRVVATTFGTVVLSGSWGTTLDSGAVARTDTGTKHYVDAAIEITPDAVNEVGDPHVFNVTATAYPSGASPVSFGPITPSVSTSPSSSFSSTCATPTVSGNIATCTITVNSTTFTRLTANATASITMGGVTVTRSTAGNQGPGGTGAATKDYVDASVAIGPSLAYNPKGTSHTFDITVTAHAGQASPTTFVSIVPVVTPAPDGGSASTCASPQIAGNVATCSLTITSTVAGTFSADVSTVVRIAGISLSRSTLSNAGPQGTQRAIKHFIDIGLTKTGATLAHVGDTVTYTMVATNLSQVALAGVSLSDPMCSSAPVLLGGDINGDRLLDPTESWRYSCTHVIAASDGDPVHNVAMVSGSVGGSLVTATAAWDVDVIHPSISIDKTANPISGAPGDPVTFTYLVMNTGDTDLFGVTVDDDKLGHIGDIPTLTVGSSVTLTKASSVGSTGITNIGTAAGADVLGKIVSDTDDATITSVLPFVIRRELPKTGTDLVPPIALSLFLIIIGAMFVKTSNTPRLAHVEVNDSEAR